MLLFIELYRVIVMITGRGEWPWAGKSDKIHVHAYRKCKDTVRIKWYNKVFGVMTNNRGYMDKQIIDSVILGRHLIISLIMIRLATEVY